jgi:tetratricopeptide (TPR) repeat protein
LANIAIAYAKDGKYPQSLEVTEAIQSDTKVGVLSAVAVNYAEAGDDQTAMHIARSIQDNTLKIQTLVEIAGKYATGGKESEAIPILQESLEILNSFEDNYFKALYLTEIAGNYAKAGQQSTALKLLDRSKELSKTLVNFTEKDNEFAKITISRRDDIWGAIAIQSLKMGQIEAALSSINTLEDPDTKVKVLVEIAGFYTKSGEKDKADEVLVRAKQIAQTIEFNKSEALEAIAMKYATLEQYDEAQKVVNSIENTQRRDRWNALLECAKTKVDF